MSKKVIKTISAIIYLDASRDIIEKRILGRIVCEKCNRNFE